MEEMKGTVLKEKTALAAAGERLRRMAATSPGRAALGAGIHGLCALLLAAPGLLGGPPACRSASGAISGRNGGRIAPAAERGA